MSFIIRAMNIFKIIIGKIFFVKDNRNLLLKRNKVKLFLAVELIFLRA